MMNLVLLFELKFKLNKNVYSTACDKWIQILFTSIKSNWIVKTTFPNKINYAYRKDKILCVSILQKVKLRVL